MTTTPAEEPALVLTGDGSSESCLQPSAARDLAWFDVSWRASEDLESLSFRLIDPVGVRQAVGDTLNVPPVNFGGRIDVGGASAWRGRADVLDSRMLNWSQGGEMWAWTPIAGESGLAVLHLRLDPAALRTDEGASFDGVTARYRTADGETGTVEAEVESRYWAKGHCRL